MEARGAQSKAPAPRPRFFLRFTVPSWSMICYQPSLKRGSSGISPRSLMLIQIVSVLFRISKMHGAFHREISKVNLLCTFHNLSFSSNQFL